MVWVASGALSTVLGGVGVLEYPVVAPCEVDADGVSVVSAPYLGVTVTLDSKEPSVGEDTEAC